MAINAINSKRSKTKRGHNDNTEDVEDNLRKRIRLLEEKDPEAKEKVKNYTFTKSENQLILAKKCQLVAQWNNSIVQPRLDSYVREMPIQMREVINIEVEDDVFHDNIIDNQVDDADTVNDENGGHEAEKRKGTELIEEYDTDSEFDETEEQAEMRNKAHIADAKADLERRSVNVSDRLTPFFSTDEEDADDLIEKLIDSDEEEDLSLIHI